MKQYTPEEVARHNKPEDLWIIINGSVYNVTDWLDKHPGGRKILIKVGGTDASNQFKNFHNSTVLEQVGSKYKIGTVATGPSDKKPKQDNVKKPNNENAFFGDQIPYADPFWYQDWQSPYYNESHIRLRKDVRAFVEKEIMPFCHEWNEKGELPRDLHLKAGKLGILSTISKIPQKYLDYPTISGLTPETMDGFHEMIASDELSRCGSGGVIWGLLGGIFIGLPPVLNHGSEQLKQRVVKDCVAGRKIICLCITEPHAGSDVANLKTEAKLSAASDGTHYIVNGEKKWITNGFFADYFTVAVRTGGPGMTGISLLLLERGMPGLKTRKILTSGQVKSVMNSLLSKWSSGTGYITFEDVKVPRENLIGVENQGFKAIMTNFNHERIGMAIQANRFSRVCYEEAFKHAFQRKTFGKRLIEHPVIRLKFANMARQIEATHAWIESIVHQTNIMPVKKQNQLLGGPAALLKAHSGIVFENVAREAAQVFGGLAYTRGGQAEKVERLYRDVRAYAIPGGSEEIMLDLGVRQAIKVAKTHHAKL